MSRNALFLMFTVLLGTGLSVADTITIKGETYDDVLVRKGRARYYVQIPGDGRVFSVPIEDVDAKSVHLSGEKDRMSLLLTWRKNNTKRQESRPVKVEEKQGATPPQEDTPEMADPAKKEVAALTPSSKNGLHGFHSRAGVPLITNRGDKYNQRKKSKPLFMSRKGVVLFTNDPAKYRTQSEFVEFTVTYDIIEVPRAYRSLRTAAEFSSDNIDEIVKHYAGVYELEEALIYALIRAESNFNPYAVSGAGARGLMQLMPGTAIEMGVTDISILPRTLRAARNTSPRCSALFNDDVDMALAAYNAGPGNVIKHGGIPPFKETKAYVPRVKRYMEEYRRKKGGRGVHGQRALGG